MRSGLVAVPMLFVQAVWLLAPGLLVGITLARRKLMPAYYAVPVAALVGCLLGYGAFWVYFTNRTAGEVYSGFTVALGAAAAALILLRPYERGVLRSVDVAVPLALLYLVTLCYSSITFACSVTPTVRDLHGVADANVFCHLSGFTGDNVLPQIFAHDVVAGDPTATIWTFQNSDRPPLQAGATLMQSTLTLTSGWRITGYQLLATMLQVLWLPALWALLRSLRLPARGLTVVLTLCLESGGFFLFNSVFTWPKLLAGAMLVTAFGLLFFEPVNPTTATIAGVAAAAAMLSHPGAAFTLVPATALLLLPRRRPAWKQLALAGAAAVVLLAPWQVYQKGYDPPGDRLLKWHLAGVVNVDSRTVTQAVRDSYTKTPPGTVVRYKLDNLGTLVDVNEATPHVFGTGYSAALRGREVCYVALSLGVFNLGWLALLFPATRRRLRATVDLSRLKLILAVAGMSTAVWAVTIFKPHNTVTFLNSYATMLLLFAACGIMLTVLPRILIRILIGLNAAYFATVWVATVWRHHYLHPSYVGLAAITAIATMCLLAVLAFSPRWATHAVDAADHQATRRSPTDPVHLETGARHWAGG